MPKNLITILKTIVVFFAIALMVFVVKTNVSSKTPEAPARAENKLEETCKDWIYSRNKILKLSREGDTAGAEKSRQAMRAFQKDLDGYPPQEVAAAIDRLEKSGYRAGM